MERKDSLQWELDIDSSVFESRIVWKTSCSYDLYLNALKKNKLDDFDSLMATIPARIDIVEIKETYYVCNVKMVTPYKTITLRDTIYFAE